MRDPARERLARTLGEGTLARLQRSNAAVIGTGLLGGGIATHLGLLQVGLQLVDAGLVDEENIANQSLPAVSVGEPKPEVRAWLLRLLGAGRIEPIHARIESLGLARLADADLLATGLDSRLSRVRVHTISQRLRLPWIDCAVAGDGSRLLGTVTRYDPVCEDAACFLCRLDDAAYGALWQEGRPRGCPSWRAGAPAESPPTLAASAFGAVVSGLAALWCIDALSGRSRPGSRQLIVAGDPPRLEQVELRRSPRCRDPHTAFDPLRPVSDPMLGTLLELGAADLGAAPEALLLHDRSLVLGLRCPGCSERSGLVRLADQFDDEEVRCDRCGAELVPERIGERITADDARALADLSWAELGLPRDDVVSVEAAGRRAHYRILAGAPSGPAKRNPGDRS